MNKKLPNVFVNKNIKSNNQKVSYDNNVVINKSINIKEKINHIINDVDFVYRKHITIIYKNNIEKDVIIIGIINDNIVTLDDGLININELKDIKK